MLSISYSKVHVYNIFDENLDMLWFVNSPAIRQEQHLHAKPAKNMALSYK